MYFNKHVKNSDVTKISTTSDLEVEFSCCNFIAEGRLKAPIMDSAPMIAPLVAPLIKNSLIHKNLEHF
jgi:hypothetical protein